MKLFYTGANTFNAEQKVSKLSLGGYVSSSVVPNNFMNSLFSSVSEFAKQTLSSEAILIALKNDDIDLASNIEIDFDADWDNIISEFQVAFVASSIDNCNNVFFDKIDHASALPYLDLDNITSTNNSFSLPDMEPGTYLGIWLIRKLNKDKIKALTCAELETNFKNNIQLPTEEIISIGLSWIDDNSHSS